MLLKIKKEKKIKQTKKKVELKSPDQAKTTDLPRKVIQRENLINLIINEGDFKKRIALLSPFCFFEKPKAPITW